MKSICSQFCKKILNFANKELTADELELEQKFDSTEILMKKFLNSLSEQQNLLQPINMGVFPTLELLANQAELWNLKIILMVAKDEPISSERLFETLGDNISKSSLYRKINDFIQKKIFFKDQDGLVRLDLKYKSLSLLGQLHQSLKNNE